MLVACSLCDCVFGDLACLITIIIFSPELLICMSQNLSNMKIFSLLKKQRKSKNWKTFKKCFEVLLCLEYYFFSKKHFCVMICHSCRHASRCALFFFCLYNIYRVYLVGQNFCSVFPKVGDPFEQIFTSSLYR